VAHKDSSKAIELFEKGSELMNPCIHEASEDKIKSMRAELDRFAKMGKIEISKSSIPPHMRKDFGRGGMKKFAVNRGEGYRVGRGPTKVPGRDRSPTG
jgi:hypothetical protein